MFLRKNFFKNTGRTYLYIVEGYRDQNGKSKSRVIKSIGYLDELKKEYEDRISHFTAVAKAMTCEAAEEKEIVIRLKSNTLLERNSRNRKNYGHVVFSQIYHELELDRFWNNKARHEEFEYNTNSIMKLLVFARLIYPGSKKKAHELKDCFFDIMDFTLDDVYNSLSFFDRNSKACQKFMHERITEKFGRETDLIYYDVTNYYFETECRYP